ncbi:recombinase family protein [Streptomyces bacillaris]|uniref:recombinase family protein n=1 Tax=Streptomyces bacillaris TaxID=68179 RepID=UPI00345F3337
MNRLVGAYTRISEIGEIGDGRDGREGVIRQGEDCVEIAANQGVGIYRVYEDNDLSAYKRRVKRPEFERLLGDLESGVIAGIVVYNIDRLARQPSDLERLIDIYEKAKRPLTFATGTGDFDLTTSDGRFFARLMVNVANKSSADTARRLARQRLAHAKAGKPHPGIRAFGWSDLHHVNEEEAAHIRKAHDDLLKGKRMSTIHREWVAAGIRTQRTPKDKNISYSAVLYAVTNPRLCGYRSYVPVSHREKHGRTRPWDFILEDLDGKPIVGEWETIVTPEQWRAVIDVITERAAAWKTRRPGASGVKRLLSGIARCGACGSSMQAGVYGRKSPSYAKWVYNYACKQVSGGCAKVTRVGPPVDQLVEGVLLEHLKSIAEKATAEEEIKEPPELAQARQALEKVAQEKEEVRAYRAADQLSVGEFVKEIGRLEARELELKTKVAALAVTPRRGSAAAAVVLREWGDYTVDMKRHELRMSVEAVVIHPTGRGGNHQFKPESVDVLWRQ